MHIVVEQNAFKEAIGQVAKAVSSHTTIPILSGIKMEVNERSCILTGSDADMTIQVTIPHREEDKELVKVVKLGSIVIPAKYFTEVIRRAPSSTVELELLDNQVLKIAAGPALFHLNGLPAEEYPPLPELDEQQSFRIPSQLFKNMIRQTAFAAATSESRPQLTGVLFKLENRQLTMVATDSHRLARRTAQVEADETARFDQVIVPSRSLHELQRLLSDKEDLVSVVISSHQLVVKSGQILFFSRLLDGSYPDVDRILPTSFKSTFTIETQALVDTLERASLLARDSKHVVKLTVQNGQVEIRSTAPEIGQVVEEIIPRHQEGEEMSIAFNARYMTEALKAIEEEETEIHFTGALSPFMLKPVQGEHTIHLIVPVRT